MKVLIVDNKQDALDVLVMMLESMGHKVECCSTTKAAKTHVSDHAHRTDLLITDVRVPELDGFSLLRDLRHVSGAPPVVLMSANADLDMVVQALRHGALDFLSKPIAKADLQETLARVEAATSSRNGGPSLAGMAATQNYKVVLPTRRQWIGPVCQHFIGMFLPADAHKLRKDIRLAMLEALNNAVVHGNLGVTSDLKNEGDWMGFEQLIVERLKRPELAERKVTVEANYHAGVLHISIEDEGDGFDPNALPDQTDVSPLLASGRGIMLIRFAMDEVHWNARGNRIEMSKRI